MDSNMNIPQCRRCNKQHYGPCIGNNGVYFQRGQLGHRANECLVGFSNYRISNQM